MKSKNLAQEDPSKADAEEAAQAKIDNANNAKLAKNEEALKENIEKTEKHKEDLDAAHRDGSSEEMQPTIKKAESELKKNNKKVSTDLKKLGADNTKTAIGEAKGDDDAMKAAFPNVAAGASLKAFPKASLAQKS